MRFKGLELIFSVILTLILAFSCHASMEEEYERYDEAICKSNKSFKIGFGIWEQSVEWKDKSRNFTDPMRNFTDLMHIQGWVNRLTCVAPTGMCCFKGHVKVQMRLWWLLWTASSIKILVLLSVSILSGSHRSLICLQCTAGFARTFHGVHSVACDARLTMRSWACSKQQYVHKLRCNESATSVQAMMKKINTSSFGTSLSPTQWQNLNSLPLQLRRRNFQGFSRQMSYQVRVNLRTEAKRRKSLGRSRPKQKCHRLAGKCLTR